MQTNILEYLEQTVTRVPDKVAFANDVMGITFRETYDQARSVGSFLNAEGVTNNRRRSNSYRRIW